MIDETSPGIGRELLNIGALLVLLAGLGLLVVYAFTGQAPAIPFVGEPSQGTESDVSHWIDSLPECEVEDQTDCVWFVSERGNGQGTSFVALGGTDGDPRERIYFEVVGG